MPWMVIVLMEGCDCGQDGVLWEDFEIALQVGALGCPQELHRGPHVQYLYMSPLAPWSYQPLSTYSMSCTYLDKRDLGH